MRAEPRLELRPVDHARRGRVRREEDVAEQVEVAVDQRERMPAAGARDEPRLPVREGVVEQRALGGRERAARWEPRGGVVDRARSPR